MIYVNDNKKEIISILICNRLSYIYYILKKFKND
jgi:hypothetical protein